MTVVEALILGIIQGVTEFLPISSSGHLILGQHFFGLQETDQYILFDLICHIGTLLPICFLFSNEIRALFSRPYNKFQQLILGTLPLFPLVFALTPIKSIYKNPKYLGFFFLITAFLLFLGKSPRKAKTTRLTDTLIIGSFQALAILPGVSRSGATISSAKLLGWTNKEAVSFSFLLAIPAIIGGMVLEILTLIQTPQPILPISVYFAGFLSSMVVGFGALFLVVRLVNKEKLHYFVWYCVILGIYTLWIYN